MCVFVLCVIAGVYFYTRCVYMYMSLCLCHYEQTVCMSIVYVDESNLHVVHVCLCVHTVCVQVLCACVRVGVCMMSVSGSSYSDMCGDAIEDCVCVWIWMISAAAVTVCNGE